MQSFLCKLQIKYLFLMSKMYSGSDSTESLQNQNWPQMNPMYPNNPDQIDWAALAQQWIIMKEAGPPAPEYPAPPSPPPAPIIRDEKRESLSEGGEAPMEVENDKEDLAQTQWSDMSSTEGSWNWHQQQQWGYSWNPTVTTNMTSKAPLLPTPGSYNQYSTVPPEVPANFHKPAANEYSSSYWNSSSNKSKPHNKRFSKVNVPQKHSAPAATVIADPITLDANRRKQLPAWIRDGLEKMERDKLKQLEKDKEKNDSKGEEVKPKFNQKEALEIIKSTVKEREKSKFDSDGEDSSNDVRSRLKRRSKPESVMISYEELMLRIRRAMTEILLNVTNQEIMAVCKEEVQRRLRKRKASDQRLSASSGTILSAKLGVGIYGGESGSSGDESDSNSEQDSGDSEAELKAAIRRRKAAFVKTEREIEERLATVENPTDEGDRARTPDIHQSQVDSKYQDYRAKLGSVGTATSPKYATAKHAAGKGSPSNSSSSDSNSSLKRYEQVQTRKLSNSDVNQRYTRDYKRDDKSESPDRSTNQRSRHSNEGKYTESHSRSRRSRSKSNSSRRNRSRSKDRYQDHRNSKQNVRKSRSRSSSISYRSTESTSKRSDSYSRSNRYRKSRSRSRSRHRKSNSSERSLRHSRNSRSNRKSQSFSPDDYYRRSRSRSSSRGKRSHRH